MHSFSKYDVLIFDCDGVLFDSNMSKVKAMELSLLQSGAFNTTEILANLQYFKRNFGKSRYHHIEIFLEGIEPGLKDILANKILHSYSAHVDDLYERIELVSGVPQLLDCLSTKDLYVVSGSEEIQLRNAFSAKSLDNYFVSIYGSPASKVENLQKVLKQISKMCTPLFIGDALTDLKASKQVGIDFAFFSKHSLDYDGMIEHCHINGYPVVNEILELLS